MPQLDVRCSGTLPLLFLILAGTSLYYMLPLFGVFRRAVTTMADSYISGSASMAFVTVPNMEVAKKLSHGLVQNKLVACVNIIPGITSVYEWENKVEEDGELLLMMKTMTSKITEVSEYVRNNHPYDVAEVISSKIDNGNPPYLQWISDVTTGGKAK
ncbi:protein CutA homolog [Babylonia areolata]|uniref:protein CutA homolog n=1 Tax=Babylonia areolata TaxID=304850 RepID=UPI003FD682C2